MRVAECAWPWAVPSGSLWVWLCRATCQDCGLWRVACASGVGARRPTLSRVSLTESQAVCCARSTLLFMYPELRAPWEGGAGWRPPRGRAPTPVERGCRVAVERRDPRGARAPPMPSRCPVSRHKPGAPRRVFVVSIVSRIYTTERGRLLYAYHALRRGAFAALAEDHWCVGEVAILVDDGAVDSAHPARAPAPCSGLGAVAAVQSARTFTGKERGAAGRGMAPGLGEQVCYRAVQGREWAGRGRAIRGDGWRTTRPWPSSPRSSLSGRRRTPRPSGARGTRTVSPARLAPFVGRALPGTPPAPTSRPSASLAARPAPTYRPGRRRRHA